MPKRTKKSAKSQGGALEDLPSPQRNKDITTYFPPSPPSEGDRPGLQIYSETIYYNGPSEEERLGLVEKLIVSHDE